VMRRIQGAVLAVAAVLVAVKVEVGPNAGSRVTQARGPLRCTGHVDGYRAEALDGSAYHNVVAVLV
jgi:hypothetical protein